MTSRRRSKANSITTIYWRDIPAQITATFNGENHKVLLEPRFQHAIDRAATVAGLTETHDYVNEWRQVQQPLEEDPATASERAAADIQSSFDRQKLEDLVASGGLAQSDDTTERTPK